MKEGTTLTIQEALKILEEKNITSSIQMLRRWIRQKKIEAVLPSKKEGYQIKEASLNEFIDSKLAEQPPQSFAINANDLELKYSEGYNAAKETYEILIEHAVKEREKQLILEGLKEYHITYTTKQLLHGFERRQELNAYFKSMDIHAFTINVLGAWVYDDQLGILFDYTFLPYPNRKVETRVRERYAQELMDHFEKNE